MTTTMLNPDTLPLKLYDARLMPERLRHLMDVQLPTQLRFIILDRLQTIDMPVLPYMIIGRKSTNNDREVVLDLAPFGGQERGVSRYHAMIISVDGQLVIKDMNSKNGTLLNGFALKPSVEYPLSPNDTITVGDIAIQICFIGVAG